jgi:hypothetical protein
LIDYTNERREWASRVSIELLPNISEKMETFIKYGNGLERREWEIQNGWGWKLSAVRFFKSSFLSLLVLWAGTT